MCVVGERDKLAEFMAEMIKHDPKALILEGGQAIASRFEPRSVAISSMICSTFSMASETSSAAT